ncbi:MAG: toprim domain-containing protein [Methanomassiliicoccales archaeon]|jgi:dTMP kinase
MIRRPKEALDQLTTILEELESRPEDVVLLVEGKRDRGALNLLGVWGEIVQVQTSDGILGIAEDLALRHKKAIILTDWDRKGGQLCLLLKNALKANSVEFEATTRSRLVHIVSGDIKDVESLPSFFSRLVAQVEGPASAER